MRIGFIGTGGTGKTTLVNALTDTWDNYGMVKLPFEMREVLGKYSILNENDMLKLENKNDVADIQFSGLNKRIQAEEDHANISWYSDRTMLDHFIYILSWCGTTHFDDFLWEHYIPKIIKSLQSYDAIFYFPKGAFHNPDGIRLTSHIYHEIFDHIAMNYLTMWNISFMPMWNSDIDVRKLTVEDEIKYVLKYHR